MHLHWRALFAIGLLAVQPAWAAIPSTFAVLPMPIKQRVCGMLLADISAQQVKLARQNVGKMTAETYKVMLLAATEALIFLEATGGLEERAKAQAEAYAHSLEDGETEDYMAVVQTCHTRYRPRKTEAEVEVFVEDAQQVLREQLAK